MERNQVSKVILWVLLIVILAITPLAGACAKPTPTPTPAPAPTPSPKYGDVKFLTAMGGVSAGSAYGIMAKQVSHLQECIPEINTTTIEGGSSKNIIAIEQGKADMGYASHGHVLAASKGDWEIGKPAENLRWFKHFVGHALTFHVRNDSPTQKMEDLLGTHIALKPKGFGSNDPGLAVLAEYGITPESNKAAGGTISYLGTGDQARGLQDETVDAIVGVTPPFSRTKGLLEADEMFGLRMLQVDPTIIQKVISQNPDLGSTVVKGGTFKGNPEIYNTIGIMYSIYVSADLPEELVYEMAKCLFEAAFLKSMVQTFTDQITAWTPENAMLGATSPIVPIHPGVLKAAKELGLEPRAEMVLPTEEALSWMPGGK